jgi:hypothetical protein
MFRSLSLVVLLLVSTLLAAGKVDVVEVKILALNGEKFRIEASLKHDDSGWDHYANAWDVLDQNGKLLGTRVLHHPHVNEQPFTRSLTLTIPAGVTIVTVRGHDSVHGYAGKSATIAVPN